MQLIERRISGPVGGGSAPTAAGRELGERFGAFLAEAERHLEELYEKHFGDAVFTDPAAAIERTAAIRPSETTPSSSQTQGPPTFKQRDMMQTFEQRGIFAVP